jgi:hypothetical protein
MCDACARSTHRHHWAGYYFFLAMGTLAALMIGIGLATDVWQGYGLSRDSLVLLLDVAAPFVAAWWIRQRIKMGSE